MRLELGGHLNWYDAQKRRTVEVRLEEPTLLIDLLNRLHVPLSEIAVGTLNGDPIFSFEHIILNDPDSVRLYPPVDGG
jgi:sulfur carrier protein ThiS